MPQETVPPRSVSERAGNDTFACAGPVRDCFVDKCDVKRKPSIGRKTALLKKLGQL